MHNLNELNNLTNSKKIINYHIEIYKANVKGYKDTYSIVIMIKMKKDWKGFYFTQPEELI